MHGTAQRAVEPQRTQGFDHSSQVLFTGALEEECLRVFGSRHQPDRHAGDDAQIRLRKEAVKHRTDTPAVDLCGFGMRKAAESRFDALSGRQDHLETADVGEMVAIRCVPEASLHGVADQAALGTGAGRVHPQMRLPGGQEFKKLALADARFDRYVSEILIEVDDAVHAAQIQQSAIVGRRNPRAVAPVLAAADGIKRDAVAVGDADARLYFFPAAGPQDRRDRPGRTQTSRCRHREDHPRDVITHSRPSIRIHSRRANCINLPRYQLNLKLNRILTRSHAAGATASGPRSGHTGNRTQMLDK